ncbi:MAG TPA: DUF202 domain-containing protein [Egibacteraceae bacterium]|nr:DUF202 domain-containing protein [Egibacteraceae bacterium]
MSSRRRSSLSDVGDDPDARFSLANQRTYLAWMRTSLALVAAGIGIAALLPPFAVAGVREAASVLLVLVGTVLSAMSYRMWQRNERALRTSQPLPRPRAALVLALTVGVTGALAITAVLLGSFR